MSDYDVRARAQAGRALALKSAGGKGQAVLISEPSPGTRDAATGKVTPGVPVEQNGSGILLGYRSRDIDGTLIQRDDQKLKLSPFTTTGAEIVPPTTAATITVDGIDYKGVDIQPFSPAGVIIYIDVQLRA